MDYSPLHRLLNEFDLCLRHASPGGDRGREGYSGDGRDVCSVDAPPALRLRHDFPAIQLSAGAEQSDGNGNHCWVCVGCSCVAELDLDIQGGMGSAWSCAGAGSIVVDHRARSDGLRIQQCLQRRVGGLLLVGV